MSHSLAISKNLTAHRNKDTQSVPKSWAMTVYNIITINNHICLMIYIVKLRAQNLLVWNIAPPHNRQLAPPHNRQLAPTCAAVEWSESLGARRKEINGCRFHYTALCVGAIAVRFTQDILCVWASLSSGAARVFVIQLHSKMRYKKIRPGFRGWN